MSIKTLTGSSVRLLAAVVAGGVCLVSSADTVAWWRFGDLGSEGGKATAETTFTNLVDATKYPARAVSFNGLAISADAAYMPSTTAPFASYDTLRLVDPVSGVEYKPSMALHCPWGGDKSAKSGGAVVKSDPRLYGHGEGQSGDFTFECFFRTTTEGLERNQRMQCLAGQKSTGYEGAWMLMIYDKKMWIRCTVEDENGVRQGSATSNNGKTEVTPDEWHHAAVTFESATGTFRLYLDYKEETTCSFNKKSYICPDTTKDILIGKGPEGTESTPDRSLDGDIAEARISDACLTADQFLRFKEPLWRGDRASDDPDTLFWLSFDSTDSFRDTAYGPFVAANPKLATASLGSAYGIAFINGREPSRVTTDVAYCERMRPAAPTDAPVANAGSLQLVTNGANVAECAYVKVLDPNTSISAKSFTQEMFFKVDHPCVVGAGDTRNSYGLMCSQAFKVLINQGAQGKALCRFKTTGGDHDISSSASVNDGKWHHVAVVYDAEMRTGAFYLDYVCMGSRSDIVLRSGRAEDKTPWAFGCAKEGDLPQVFDGWIDEFRLTRRPLGVGEFLVRDGGEPEGTVAWLHFDGNFALAPWGMFEGKTKSVMTDAFPAQLIDRPRAPVITDFADNVLWPNNTGALALDGSIVWFDVTEALDLEEFTVEFFFRPQERFAPWAGPVAYNTASTLNDNVAGYGYGIKAGWMIGGKGSWDDFRYDLSVITTNRVAGGAAVITTKEFGPEFSPTGAKNAAGTWRPANFDGKWHHVALSFQPNATKTETTVKAYWDYNLEWTETLPGTVSYASDTRPTLKLGSALTNRAVRGDVDELRILNRVLDTREFMRKQKTGFILLIDGKVGDVTP